MSSEFRPIDRAEHELLVVDDDPVSRYTTVRLLQNAGFRTREAATGMEGLQLADQNVSAVVLDVHLPDIDGFELCRRLRSQPGTAGLPVLHLSAAFVTADDKVRGLDAGADAYLTHPVEPAVLVATVQALVRTQMAEAAMRLSEAKFRAIYALAPGGICLLDAQGRFVDANPAMAGFLGRDAADLLGHAVSEYVPSSSADNVKRFLLEPSGHGARMEFPVHTPGGQATLLEWTLTPHVEPNVSLAVAVDVTHRSERESQRQELVASEREARGAAERMSRMKDELIAVLSHELRTPLNAIMVWSHVLRRHGVGEQTMVDGLEAIERNGRIQARMISDILDMSRLNMGKMPLLLEVVNPRAVVDAAMQTMQPSSEENEQLLVLDAEAAHRPIRADGSRLQQIIWNLVTNAIKFSPKGSQVRIVLRDVDDGVRLSVIDQGQGIAAEFLPYLFDRFTQSDAGSNRRRGGLGLGLAIVRHLVEAHGGTISVSSEGVGKGARFDIWLPAEPPEIVRATAVVDGGAEDDANAAVPDGALNGLHLLLVDDDPDACAMLSIILSDRGALTTTVNGYDEALAALDTLTPDLLISDIGMPGKDGYDLMREIRRREAGTGQRIPAIALTSFSRAQDEQAALGVGFDLHSPKPLRPMKLIQAVRSLVDRARRPTDSRF